MNRITAAYMLAAWLAVWDGASIHAAWYDMGSPVLTDIWVNPSSGDDARSGATSAQALRTLAEAWNRIPSGSALSGTGYRIALMPGDYPADGIPGWMAARYGTAQCPVVIEAVGGPGTARLHGYLDISDCRYLYLVRLDVVTDSGYGGGGNVIHLASCSHVLLRGCTLNGWDGATRQPQETLKVNQSQYLYVEQCEIRSAQWYPLDFVAVQYGHVVSNRIHDAGEWCAVIKGGSASLLLDGNRLYNGRTGGFVAGNGTGFNYMTSPWIHYEAADIKFVNNIIDHTGTVGMGVNGGYNVLLAFNTLYRAGTNDHLLEVLHGAHGCNENPDTCAAYQAAGGWGNSGSEEWYVPSRNVYVYNNLFFNPDNTTHGWQHLRVDGAVTPLADQNMHLRGNIIWNGDPSHPLGIEDPSSGCQPDNPTCNEILIRADNLINTLYPQLTDPENGDFRPVMGADLFSFSPWIIPSFPGGDRPQPPLAPEGDLINTILYDRSGRPRDAGTAVGAQAYPPTPPPGSHTRLDFDGDAISDIGCYYAPGGNWYMYKSSAGFFTDRLGYEGTYPVCGDFDGDGVCDYGTYYPPDGGWIILRSTLTTLSTHFGYAGTVPITGDFDGDGIDDFGCYDAPLGGWSVYKSREGFWSTRFGYAGTVPVTGDFDGDGVDDFGCYDAPTGGWYIYKSHDGFWVNHFGYTGTVPLK